MRVRALPLLGAIVGAVVLSACSSPSPASQTGAAASPAAVQKVNANTASQDQIQRALEAAGVPNAAQWAHEVVEYRPYPTGGDSFAKLRQGLTEHNASPDVVNKILASVTP